MTSDPAVPPPFAARPHVPGDVDAVVDVIGAAEEHDLGEVLVEREDVVAGWARPSVDLAADTCGVWDGPRLVATAEVVAGRASASVAPDARGRGLGTTLRRWSEQRARAAGARRVGQTVPATGPAGTDLLRRAGYAPAWTTWILALPEGARVPDRPPPPGVVLRPARLRTAGRGEGTAPPADAVAAHAVVQAAFGEWPGHEPEPYGDWAAEVVDRPGSTPDGLLLAERDGAVVGVCHLLVSPGGAWVHQLAVARPERGRGIAQALLVRASATARARGADRFELSTDSRTGARDLYERVGMRVTTTFTHWTLEL